jgi:hypothetical protein
MPFVPARPAAYIRIDAAEAEDESNVAYYRGLMASFASEVGWPEPVVYLDAGRRPGSQYDALVKAITAGRHDAVMVPSPEVIGRDLGLVEAFDRHCRQHGVRLSVRHGRQVTEPRALFDVIRHVRRFTVTEEHLRLLRRAYVSWYEGEFGAPGINCKRPYGNSHVWGDIAEILELPDSEWADEDMSPLPDAEWRFMRLHVETGIALQIVLATGEFRAGSYRREDTGGLNWIRDETVVG